VKRLAIITAAPATGWHGEQLDFENSNMKKMEHSYHAVVSLQNLDWIALYKGHFKGLITWRVSARAEFLRCFLDRIKHALWHNFPLSVFIWAREGEISPRSNGSRANRSTPRFSCESNLKNI
jgi:hypothetical protein